MVPLVEAELVGRLRSADVAYEPRHVLADASDESDGVEEPELVAECGRMVVEAAAMVAKAIVAKAIVAKAMVAKTKLSSLVR